MSFNTGKRKLVAGFLFSVPLRDSAEGSEPLSGDRFVEKHSSRIPTSLRTLRRRVGVIVLCCVLTPVCAFAFSARQQKQYTASASLLFRDPGFDQKLFGSQVFESSPDPARAAATNVKLVSLDVVGQRTAKRLPAAGSVKDKVQIRAEGQSDVVAVSATYPDPRLAAIVANTFARQYIGFRREADRAKIAEARALVQRRVEELSPGDQSSQARSLRNRLEQLDVLASLQTGNAELAEVAEVPSAPSSPRVVRNTLVGGFLGLLLGVGLALLLERLDRRLRDPKEIEEIFDRPILGAIPESRTLGQDGPAQEGLPPQEREAFMMLRANLRYFNIDRGGESVLVTSAAPGDGKSTVAWNLGSTAAGTGARVLIIEADLRRPTIAISRGLHAASGLSTVLSGEIGFRDAVQHIQVQQTQIEEKGNGRGFRTVDVLLAGPLPPNPADLLESDRMRELISTAESDYDLVVIDTPPASVLSDAIPLVKQVGGVIVVSRLAKSTREATTHLRNQLRHLDAPVLGLVVNGIGSDAEAYGYGYGYGYAAGYMRESGEPEPETALVHQEPEIPSVLEGFRPNGGDASVGGGAAGASKAVQSNKPATDGDDASGVSSAVAKRPRRLTAERQADEIRQTADRDVDAEGIGIAAESEEGDQGSTTTPSPSLPGVTSRVREPWPSDGEPAEPAAESAPASEEKRADEPVEEEERQPALGSLEAAFDAERSKSKVLSIFKSRGSKGVFITTQGHCSVCQRMFMAGTEEKLKLSGWRVSGEVGVCPECQSDGWHLPEGAKLPLRQGSA